MLRSRPLTVMAVLVLCALLAARGDAVIYVVAAGCLILYIAVANLIALGHDRSVVRTVVVWSCIFTGLVCTGMFRMRQVLQEQTSAQAYYAASVESEETQISGTVCDVQTKEDSIAVCLKDVWADDVYLNRTICYTDGYDAMLQPGDRVTVSGKASIPDEASNEGGFDGREYYSSRNIFGTIRKAEILVTHRPAFCPEASLWKLRRSVSRFYEQALRGEESGILAAIALGERTNLDDEARSLLEMAGLAHILAISGMHVSVVGMEIWKALRKKLPYLPCALITTAVLIAYCQMTGCGVSARRATLMCLVYIAGQVVGVAADSLNSISLAAILFMLQNPLCIHDPSFRFSFAATGCVICIAAPLKKQYERFCSMRWEKTHFRQHGMRWRPSLKEMLIRSLIFSAAMQLAVLPVVAENYYEVPVYTAVLNLILLPLLGYMLGFGLVGGFLGAAGSAVSAASMYTVGNGVTSTCGFASRALTWCGRLLLGPCHLIIYLYEWAADLSLDLPYSRYITGKPPVWIIALFYCVLLVCVQGRRLVGRREAADTSIIQAAGGGAEGGHLEYRTGIAGHGGGGMSKSTDSGAGTTSFGDKKGRRRGGARASFAPKAVRIAAVAAVTLLVIHYPYAHPTEITMLDVGQGDGLYLCDGEGHHLMIDGGSSNTQEVGERVILPFLKSRGIRRVDAWFVSHTDEDHISGLLEALQAGYPIDCIVFSNTMQQEARKEAGQRIQQITQGSGYNQVTSEAEDNTAENNDNYQRIVDAAAENGTRVLSMEAGDVIDTSRLRLYREAQEDEDARQDLPEENASDGFTITCLWPDNSCEVTGINENALVLLFKHQDFTFLTGGDIGEEEEEDILKLYGSRIASLGTIDLFKANHHGSNYSNSEAFLGTLKPARVWISAGRRNIYGHPGDKALSRIAAYAGEWLCTIGSGQITLREEDGAWREYVRFLQRDGVR